MSLKVGDRVKLNPESEFVGDCKNPTDEIGGVIAMKDTGLGVRVQWSYCTNSYSEHDLILQEEVKEVMNTNKIGELITDWSELEVGDKAVFEGYTDKGSRDWRFTVGKEYVCGIDDDCDKGFIEDEDSDGDTHGCPIMNHNTFKFRLVSKAHPDFPTFPFKLRNGDKPEVRQWLKDNGVTWCDGDDVTETICSRYNPEDGKFLLIDNLKELYTMDTEWDYLNRTETKDVQEIQLDTQPAKVLRYSLVEVANKNSEKELQLEEIVAKLSAQLNEAQTELNKIK